jgi:hypothetical protein
MNRPDSAGDVELEVLVLVVGGGPAGLAAGLPGGVAGGPVAQRPGRLICSPWSSYGSCRTLPKGNPMAESVFRAATSHSVLLGAPPQMWAERGG